MMQASIPYRESIAFMNLKKLLIWWTLFHLHRLVWVCSRYAGVAKTIFICGSAISVQATAWEIPDMILAERYHPTASPTSFPIIHMLLVSPTVHKTRCLVINLVIIGPHGSRWYRILWVLTAFQLLHFKLYFAIFALHHWCPPSQLKSRLPLILINFRRHFFRFLFPLLGRMKEGVDRPRYMMCQGERMAESLHFVQPAW